MHIDANAEAVAVIHYGPVDAARENTPVDRFVFRGIGFELAERLWGRGVITLISRGLDAYAGGEAQLWMPDRAPLQLSLGDIGVIRDISGGFRSGDNPVVSRVDAEVAILNGPRARRLDDKAYVAKEYIFGERQPQTQVLDALPSTAAAVAELIGDQFAGVVYAKPARGAGAKGAFRLDSLSSDYQATLDTLVQEGSNRPYLLQAAINNTVPLPDEIKPENDEQARVLAAYTDEPKEFRIFWFYGRDEVLRWLPVLRVKPLRANVVDATRVERYVFIDPDTTPAELVNFTQSVLDAFAHKADIQEMSGALDFAYGSSGNSTENQWWVRRGMLGSRCRHRRAKTRLCATHLSLKQLGKWLESP